MRVKSLQIENYMPFGLSVLTFVFCMALTASPALADELIYKCGQEITNRPVDAQSCQKLELSSATQIEGTKVQSVVSDVPIGRAFQAPLQHVSAPQPDSKMGDPRSAQARTILEDEWLKLSAKHAEMVRLYNLGRPILKPGESVDAPAYQQRVAELSTRIGRSERDLQALKREINRHTSNLASVKVN